VREELMKILAGDARPSRALDLYRTSGVLSKVAPELAAGVGAPISEDALAGTDAWRYALALTRQVARRLPAARRAPSGTRRRGADAAQRAAQLNDPPALLHRTGGARGRAGRGWTHSPDARTGATDAAG
jgi:hypothetical protein